MAGIQVPYISGGNAFLRSTKVGIYSSQRCLFSVRKKTNTAVDELLALIKFDRHDLLKDY